MIVNPEIIIWVQSIINVALCLMAVYWRGKAKFYVRQNILIMSEIEVMDKKVANLAMQSKDRIIYFEQQILALRELVNNLQNKNGDMPI